MWASRLQCGPVASPPGAQLSSRDAPSSSWGFPCLFPILDGMSSMTLVFLFVYSFILMAYMFQWVPEKGSMRDTYFEDLHVWLYFNSWLKLFFTIEIWMPSLQHPEFLLRSKHFFFFPPDSLSPFCFSSLEVKKKKKVFLFQCYDVRCCESVYPFCWAHDFHLPIICFHCIPFYSVP